MAAKASYIPRSILQDESIVDIEMDTTKYRR